MKIDISSFTFFRPEVDKIKFVQDLFLQANVEHCEFNIVNVYNWNDSVDYRWFQYEKWTVLYTADYDMIYRPFGEEATPLELCDLSDQFIAAGHSGDIILILQPYVDKFGEELEKYFDVLLDREMSDYVYSSESLATLSGRHLSKKRNLVHQFHKAHPKFKVELLRPQHLPQVCALAQKWRAQKELHHVDDNFKEEYQALELSIRAFEVLKLEAVGVFVGDELVAFAIFSKQTNDMITVHFEKADPQVKGAAQVINQETAKILHSRGVRWINREQDLNEPGLRQAKLSYYPSRMIDTYILQRKK